MTEQELAQIALNKKAEQQAAMLAQEQEIAAEALRRRQANQAQTTVQDAASSVLPAPVALAAGQVAGGVTNAALSVEDWLSKPKNAREVVEGVGAVAGGALGAGAAAVTKNPAMIMAGSAAGTAAGSAIADVSSELMGLDPSANLGEAASRTLTNAAGNAAADLVGTGATKIARNPFAKGLSEEGKTLQRVAEEAGIANPPVAMTAAGNRTGLETAENATGASFFSGFGERKVRIQQAVTDQIKATIDKVRGSNTPMEPGNLRLAVQDGLNAYKKATYDKLEETAGEIAFQADQAGVLVPVKGLKQFAKSPFITKALTDVVAPGENQVVAQKGYGTVLKELESRGDNLTLSEAYGIRKRLNDIRLNSSGANSLEQTEATAIQDLTKNLDAVIGQSKQGKELLANVNKVEQFSQEIDNGVLASLANKESGTVGNYIATQDAVNVAKVRKAILAEPKGKETWKQVQAEALNSIMLKSRENADGVLNGSTLVNDIKKINKGFPGDPGYVDNLSKLVGADAAGNFQDLAKALARAQSKSSKEFELAIRSAQTATGAAVVLQNGSKGGTLGAVVMFAPGAFNRLMANKNVAKWLVEGVQKPAGTKGLANRSFAQVIKNSISSGEKVNVVVDGQQYELEKGKPVPSQVKRLLN